MTSTWKTAVLTGLLIVFLCVAGHSQSATVSLPVGIGTDGCAGGAQGIRELTYNPVTNVLNNTHPICTPSLGGVGFTAAFSSVAFNPADHLMYYIRVIPSGGGMYDSHVYRWNPYACPGPALPVYQTYIGQFIAGLAFDKNGIGWQVNFTGTIPYGLEVQRIDFATGTIGAPQTVVLPAGLNINAQQGDIEMTPSGLLFAVFDNKMMALNYQEYGTGTINATYINTLTGTAGNSLVGLAYTNGKFLGHLMGPGCIYQEIDILTGVTSAVTYPSSFAVYDFTNIGSGIGASKKLVSSIPTATAGTYDIAYDIRVENFGNVADSNLQVTDNLAAVFGAGNISNVSLSWVGSAPLGFNLNGAYNGVGTNELLVSSASNVLKNFPLNENNFTIRISLRVSNIVAGAVYSNNATVTATGYRGVSLQDQSTNGIHPDLNNNDKADDPGESQSTPFVIQISPEATPCASLKTVLYSQTFGTGSGLSVVMPGTSKTDYTGSVSAPIPIENFSLSNNAINGNATSWINLTDHTANANGRMMLVNADVLGSRIFLDTINVNCSNVKYSFFTYAAFIGNSNYSGFCNAFGGFKYPKLTFVVRNSSDLSIITNYTTADISSTSWNLHGMKFVLPAGVTKVIIEIYNAAEGGCGNDLALDDIQFGLCDALPSISINGTSAGCVGSATTINASLSDTAGMSSTLVYQWQSSIDNVVWTDITGAISLPLTINPVGLADGKYYRLLVAATGSIGTSCQYISNSLLLITKSVSVAPTAITKNRVKSCPGENIILQASGGTPGINAVYRWYTGSCGGTLIGTGSSITVSPIVATTYFVRLEGDCNTTSCASLNINFDCDIDADNDGIANLAECGGMNPEMDDDFDGLENYRDADYTGFVDTNSDGVNDHFDSDLDGVPNFLDLDSDNDGIPDVVEAGGVDANADGKIDNYSDTDGDGLSQNLDANNTGAAGSGVGLGMPDLDNDGVANFKDLDSDNDGIPDLIEVYGVDVNNDGKIDVYSDSDADGYSDNVDGDVGNDAVAENILAGLLRTGADANNNGRADTYPDKNMDMDSRANPYDLDSDGDGIADVVEAQFTDANYDGMIDGAISLQGWNVVIDALPAFSLFDRDGTGRANIYDIDADDDGIPDNVEGQSTPSYILPLDNDVDGDGIDNAYDNISGFGGRGISVFNMDGDAFPDYLDNDTDGDGQVDLIEGNDFNFNKLPDDDTGLSGLDTDLDGLDNHFDINNSSCKGTVAYMGNGGSTSGDGSPGSRTVVQKSWSEFIDRDWRMVEYVLNVDYISFTASLNKSTVTLKWTVLNKELIRKYIIERSVDGLVFETIGSVNGVDKINGTVNYQSVDHVGSLKNKKIFYRIKSTGISGKLKYSCVVFIIKEDAVSAIEVMPNPVRTDLKLLISAPQATHSQIKIIDASGRIIIDQKHTLDSGSNSIIIPQSCLLQNGYYVIQVTIGDQIHNRNFIIKH